MMVLREDKSQRELLVMVHLMGHEAPSVKMVSRRWACPKCGARVWQENGRFALEKAYEFCRTVEDDDRDEYWRQRYVSKFVTQPEGA